MSVLSGNPIEVADMLEPVQFLDVTVNLTPMLPKREDVLKVQDYLATLPQIEAPVDHYFADGMYGRNCHIPAGSIVVGKIHRHEHFVLLIKGSATINTDKGMETISAPHIWVSPPGAKRILHTLEDCEFFTCHLNPENTRDLLEIEAEVIEPEVIQLTHTEQLEDLSDDIQRAYL